MLRLLPLAILVSVLLGPGEARPASLTVRITSVSARSNSAAISWGASAPVRAHAEYGQDNQFGLWTKRTNLLTSGRILLGALEPNRTYQFRIVASDGTEVVYGAGSFQTRPMRLASVARTTANALVVDTQALFPRMVFQTCAYYYDSSLAAGINLFMGNACAPTAQIQLLAGRAYSVVALPRRGLTGRGLIGWFQHDEPDGFGLTSLPRVPSSRESGRVTFLTLTDHFSDRAAPLPVGKAVYPRLISRAEMVGFDTYPLQTRCSGDFTYVYDMQKELAALAAGKPTFQWIETGAMGKCPGHDPTAATIRAETWLAIAGGARGIGYFPDFWPGEIGQTIAATNEWIAALAPALLAPSAPVSYGPDGTPVKAGARTLDGATYVIAANPSYGGANATFTVPGLRAASVSVYGEGRTLPVVNGRFSDAFSGLGVHVYVAAPPGL